MNRPGPATPQHRSSTDDPGRDAGPARQGPDLPGAHEALLPDELAGGVRRHAGSPQGLRRTDARSSCFMAVPAHAGGGRRGNPDRSVPRTAPGAHERGGRCARFRSNAEERCDRLTPARSTGLIAQVLLLAALAGDASASAAPAGSSGSICGVIMNAALARGLARYGSERLGPADWVTLTRATLAVGVAALVADSFDRPAPVALLVALTAVALVAGRRRRLDRAAHGDGDAARRAVRRRGRRVPDPRPQRVRRPLGRRVGARDRRGALRVPRSRVAAAVDACSRCRRATGARSSRRRRGSCWRSRRPTSCRWL